LKRLNQLLMSCSDSPAFGVHASRARRVAPVLSAVVAALEKSAGKEE
jgi:hypothetical protein